MKKYKLEFDENTHRIERISIVDVPAVGDGIVYFSEEKEDKTVFFESDEKMIFYSVAMRPNTLIFRSNVSDNKDVVEPAEVFYTAETANKVMQSFWKNYANKETNINHTSTLAEGVYPFESWQVMNAEIDKSKTMGLTVRNGDIVMGYKVENPEIWQDVKDGKIGGLSIESNFRFEESTNTNFNKEEMTKEEEKKQSFFEMLASFFSSETPKEKTAEEIAAEEEAKKKKEEEMAGDPPVEDAPAVDVEALQTENADLKQQVAELQEKLSKAEAMVVEKDAGMAEMSKQVLEMSKQASTKSESEMSALEKFREKKQLLK